MKRRLLIIYVIGSVLTSIALLISTKGAFRGSYYFFGLFFNMCTLVVFNTLFFFILHKLKYLDVLKTNIINILAICSVTLLFPALIDYFACSYFYNSIFVDSVNNDNVFSHERVLWLSPLYIHFYIYLLVFIIFIVIHNMRPR